MNTEVKLFIIVEGINDIVFLKDFLEVHFGCKTEIKLKSDTVLLEISDIIIYSTKGKDVAGTRKQNLIQEINKREPKNIIFIFDADNDYKTAESNILDICSGNDCLNEAKYFLFPDNENIGDLENILESIVVEKNVFECWNNFEECISSKNNVYTIPAKKSKIHTYLEVLNPNTKSGKDNCKEVNRDYKDKTKWNLDDLDIVAINKLKSFLNQFINNNNE